jgi:nitrate/nitrite transporter NarK
MSDRGSRRGRYVWPFLLVAAAAFYASYLVKGGSFEVSFVLLIVAAAGMYAPYGPYFASITELLPATDAAPALGMINAFGGLGGFLGSYLVGWLGGGTGAAFLFLASCLLASAVLMLIVRPPRGTPRDDAYPTEAATGRSVGAGAEAIQ